MPDFVPSVRQRRIARVLRGWREDRGLRSGAIAVQTGWSAAKQSRLETAGQPITPADVMTLALIYDVPEDERNRVFNAALTAQAKGWWEELAQDALVDDVMDYVELESEATGLKTFKVDLVHGLFQTEEYAAAVLRAYRPRPAEETIQERVKVRIKRQDRLTGDNPIETQALVAEGALRMVVGSPRVMRRQLDRLCELGDLPHLEFRVLPASAGAHASMGTGFNLLTFGDHDPDVGYIEFLHKGIYLEEREDVDSYKISFADMWEQALDRDASAELIATIARSMAT